MAEKDELATEWTGHDLYDQDGDKIGKIEDVRYGDVSCGLQWLVVDTGEPGAKKVFVPAAKVRRSGDRISAVQRKDRVTSAPVVQNEQSLTQDDESRLCRFYGLQYGSSSPGQSAGCEEMKDIRPAG